MTSLRSLTSALLAAALLALAGCGGGGPDPVTTATAAVGPNGGRLTIDAAILELPAGALATEVTVVLESPPADAASGELLRLRLAPAGRRLATPAVLTIDVPGAPAATQAFWLVGGDPVLVRSTRVGDRFSLTLNSLGFGADGRQVPLAAGRARALANDEGTGGELSMRVLNCQGKVEILRKRLARLSSAGAMAEAILLHDAIVDASRNCSELEVQLLHRSVCEQLAAAVTDASATLPSSMPELIALAQRLAAVDGAVQLAGATCDPTPAGLTILPGRVDGYLAILAGQVQRGEFATDVGFQELRMLFDVEASCRQLGLDEGCDRMRTQIYPDMLDTMRRAAFDDCRDRGVALSVAQFLDLGASSGRNGPFMGLARFGMAEVEADLVQCTAPSLTARVFDTVDGSRQALPDRDIALQPLNGFADYRLTATVQAPRTGQIVLEGAVRVARCPDGNAPAADLVVRIADGAQREVARRPHNGVSFSFAPPIDLSVNELRVAAALDPATATSVALVVAQEGASCPSQVNDGSVVLDRPLPFFRLEVVVASVARVLDVQMFADSRTTMLVRARSDSCGDQTQNLPVCDSFNDETFRVVSETPLGATQVSVSIPPLGRTLTVNSPDGSNHATATVQRGGLSMNASSGSGGVIVISGNASASASGAYTEERGAEFGGSAEARQAFGLMTAVMLDRPHAYSLRVTADTSGTLGRTLSRLAGVEGQGLLIDFDGSGTSSGTLLVGRSHIQLVVSAEVRARQDTFSAASTASMSFTLTLTPQ